MFVCLFCFLFWTVCVCVVVVVVVREGGSCKDSDLVSFGRLSHYVVSMPSLLWYRSSSQRLSKLKISIIITACHSNCPHKINCYFSSLFTTRQEQKRNQITLASSPCHYPLLYCNCIISVGHSIYIVLYIHSYLSKAVELNSYFPSAS